MPLVTQASLEKYFRPRNVKEVFTDNGGQTIGPRLDAALQAGSDQAAALLGKVPAWREEADMQALVTGDSGLEFAICQLVMAVGIAGKPEWHSDGNDQASSMRRQARETIKDMVSAATRPKSATDVGENTVNHTRVANSRQFEFARRRNKDSSGGY